MNNTLTIRIAVFCALLTACVQAPTYAQSMANYGTPVRSTGIIYNSIEYSGSAIYSWRNNEASTEDDNRSYPVPIGFDFYYCGERYTTFSASTNGFIDFSSSTRDGGPGNGTRSNWAFGPYDQDLSTSNRSSASGDGGTVLAIAPFYYDLTTQGELDPLGGSVKYLVTGSAPNRVLTVEWIRMAIWTNTTPNFNFQVKLYETSGRIEFVYSTMNLGTFNFGASPTNGYTVGMSGPVLATAPTPAQALIQQTANATTFSNTRQNDLRTVPTSNSALTFTPPVPLAPTNLTFTGISTTGMTLHWGNNATNEVGYVIYCSEDGGATYNFVRKLAANAVSSVETGLVPGVNYFWRVYAITEGAMSAPLSGSMATTAPGQYISAQTGDWDKKSTWVGNTVPPPYSDVTINNGHTVTINQNIQVSDLTVGQGTSGTLLIGDNGTARTITVAGNIDVRAGAVFETNSTATHVMILTGNVTNAGTFDMMAAAGQVCNVTFRRQGSQSISGTGPVTRFNRMTLDMGASGSNILDVSAVNFSAAANFLTLVDGTFNLASAASITPFTATSTIPITAGLVVNNASAVVTTTGGDLNVNGELAVHAGMLNVGSAANNDIVSYGGRFVFDGGTVNVAGGFMPKDNYTITDFTMANTAVVTLNTRGCTSTTYAPFTMLVSGSRFVQTGGTLVIQQKGGAAGSDSLGYTNYFYSIYTVTGGTLQLGNASTASAQVMKIRTSIPVYNLNVYNSNITAVLNTYALTVNNDVMINGGTLNSNALNMSVGGSWTSTGTFNPTTAGVTFTGGGARTLMRTGGETFNRLTVMKPSGTLTMNSSATITGAFALTAGTLAVQANTLTLNSTVTGGGTLTSLPAGTVSYNQGADNQTVLLANYGNLNFSGFIKVLPSSGVVGIAGSFTTPKASGHAIAGSTISFNGSGAQSIAPFTFNNLQLVTGGTKTFAAGTDSVKGDFTIAAGVTADGAGNIVALKNIAHAGVHTGAGRITLAGGTAAHALTGAGTYGNLTLNDALGATIGSDLVIAGQLMLTSGVISPLGSERVIITPAGGVVRTAGWVNGTMQRAVAAGSPTLSFDIGDAAHYTPAVLTLLNVAAAGGTIDAKTTQADHPQLSGSNIDPTNSVNRYWALMPTGLTFDSCRIEFAWIHPDDQDVSGSEQFYTVSRYASGAWDTVRSDIRTLSSIRAVRVTSFGEFAVGFNGNANAYRTKGSGLGSGNWNAATIWQYFNVQTNAWRDTTAYPVAANAGLITIQSGDNVTVPIGITTDQTIVQGGAMLTIASGQTLTVHNGTGTDLTVGGRLRNTGNDIVIESGASIAFTNGAAYQHAISGGSIPRAMWDSTSTCEVQGATAAAPANLNQSFGNFIWNSAAQSGSINLMNAPSVVAGRYVVASTGSGSLQLFGGGVNQVLTVKRSFSVLAGTVIGIAASGADNATIAVGDSLVIRGGTFTLSANNGDRADMTVAGHAAITGGTFRMTASSSTDVVTLSKNLSHTGGTISQTGSGRGRIVFNGNAPQVFTSGGTVSGAVDFVVNAGAHLVMGTNVLSGSGAFTLQNAGTLSLGSPQGILTTGAAGNVQVTGARTFGTAANYIYNGTAAQVTGSGLPATVSTLSIANPAGASLTGSVIVSDTLSLVSGAFNVQANTLSINNIARITSGTLQSGAVGTVIYNRLSDDQPVIQAAYGNLTFSNFKKILPAAEITIAGKFTPGAATGHTMAGSTINYNGADQTVAAFTYNHLKASGTGTKTLSSYGAVTTVNGDLSLLAGTFADSGYTMSVNGNLINNAVHTGAGRIRLAGGGAAHTISGTGSFTNLELNDGLGAVLSGNNLNIGGVLYLSTGVVATGANSIIIGTAGSIERATNSSNPRHVFGTITKPVPVNAGTQTVTFETGDAVLYTPVDLVFTNVTTAGTVTTRAVAAAHPNLGASGIDPAKCANRYWTLVNAGTAFTSYSINVTFVAEDVIPASSSTSAYFMKRFFAGAWTLPTLRSRGSLNLRADGLTQFGDFVAGELTDVFHWSGLAGNNLWNDANNWNLTNVPTSTNDVKLDGTNTDSINVNVAALCRNLDITNPSVVVTIQTGQSLAVGGYLKMSAGRLFTQNLLPTVGGTVTITGGTIGFTSPAAQTIPSAWTYYHLLVGGGATKTVSAAMTLNDLTIQSGTTLADNGAVITVKGNLLNAGVHSGAGKITLASGAAQHQLSGTGTYKNLELNDAAGALVVNGPRVNGVLTLTSGVMNSTADTIDVITGGSIVRTAGWITGSLQKIVPATGSVAMTFELGSASSYLPVGITLTGVTGTGGSITVSSIAGDNPDIANSPLSAPAVAHRYWTIANNGTALTSYSGSFQWAPAELQSGIVSAADLILAQKASGAPQAWSEAAIAAPTLTSIQGTGLTSYGAFQAGKPDTSTFIASANGDWNVPGTWNKNRIPMPRNGAVIGTPYTVKLTDARSIRHFSIDKGGTFDNNAQTLTVASTLLLNGTWTGAGTILWNTPSADIFYGNGGVTNGTGVLRITGSNKTFTAVNTSLYQIDLGGASVVANNGSLRCTRITGAAAGSSFTNAAGATLGIAQDLLATGTLTATAANNTVDYNGTGVQNVKAASYYHLVLSNGATNAKTASGAASILGDLTIGAGATFNASSAVLTLSGNWTNNGTFIPSTSTVILAGTAASILSGASTFATLQVNKSTAATVVTLAHPMQTGVLTMTQGRMETGSNSIVITSDRTGSGLIVGTITRTHAFAAGTPYAFEGPNNLITFNTGGTLPSSITETVTLASPGATTSMDPISRYYTLAMTGASGSTFAYRLHYEDGEIAAPNTESSLKLWHETSPAGSNQWERKGAASADAASNFVELTGIAVTETGRWTLSSRTIPNLLLTLSQDNDHPSPGSQVTYTITWQNTGDGNATNSLFTAFIPANTTLVGGSVRYNSTATSDYVVAGNVITFNMSALNGGTIPPGGTGTITYKVTIN